MRFYCGIHNLTWLWDGRAGIGRKFVNRGLITRRKTPMRRATVSYGLDSQAFTEILRHGRWTVDDRQLVADARRFRAEVGPPDICGIRDLMCEAFMLQRTGLTVYEHQQRTIDSYIELRRLDDTLPWLLTLQGHTPDDYKRHVDMYIERGIDPREVPLVGVGSVCRRQATREILDLFRDLHAGGLRMHGFGVSVRALQLGVAEHLVSSDSMAWSAAGRRSRLAPIKANSPRVARLYAEGVERILRGELHPMRDFRAELRRPEPRVICTTCGHLSAGRQAGRLPGRHHCPGPQIAERVSWHGPRCRTCRGTKFTGTRRVGYVCKSCETRYPKIPQEVTYADLSRRTYQPL